MRARSVRHPRLHRPDQDRRLVRPTKEAKQQQQLPRAEQQEHSQQPYVALDSLKQRSSPQEHRARGGHGRPDFEDRRQIRKEEGSGQSTGKMIFALLHLQFFLTNLTN